MRAICQQCEGRGAVTLNYKAGDPFDVGLCACEAGRPMRLEIDSAPEQLEKRFGVSIDRIRPLEDIREGTLLVDPSGVRRAGLADDEAMLLNAGRVNRAGLSGKAK